VEIIEPYNVHSIISFGLTCVGLFLKLFVHLKHKYWENKANTM